jgi:hypothetical protein
MAWMLRHVQRAMRRRSVGHLTPRWGLLLRRTNLAEPRLSSLWVGWMDHPLTEIGGRWRPGLKRRRSNHASPTAT